MDKVGLRIKKKLVPEDFNLVQCFFGEHLLRRYPEKKVAVVESEKTAVICSAAMSDFLWLATGGLSQFSFSKMQVLEGRDVILFLMPMDSASGQNVQMY